MAGRHQSLQGQLLLDGGRLQGSFFHRSVVLVCQHDPQGAFGLILNRPGGGKVGDALVANLPPSIKDEMLFIGGPVEPATLSFLHTDNFIPQANIIPKLNLGHSIEALMDLTNTFSSFIKIRLFAGYAGWAPGQLEMEMSRRDWLVHPATVDLVFQTNPAELWKTIVRQNKGADKWLADAPDDLSWN